MGPKHTSEIQVTDLLCLLKKATQQQIDSSESTKNTNFDAQNNGLPINDLPF
jgi:single-strand DNA-binding protein